MSFTKESMSVFCKECQERIIKLDKELIDNKIAIALNPDALIVFLKCTNDSCKTNKKDIVEKSFNKYMDAVYCHESTIDWKEIGKQALEDKTGKFVYYPPQEEQND